MIKREIEPVASAAELERAAKVLRASKRSAAWRARSTWRPRDDWADELRREAVRRRLIEQGYIKTKDTP